jgi:hypothetical protein
MGLLHSDHSDWIPSTGQVLAEHATYWTNGDKAAGRPETARKYKLDVRVEAPGRSAFETKIVMWLPIPHAENSLVGQSVPVIVDPKKDRAEAPDEAVAGVTEPGAITTISGADLVSALAAAASPTPGDETLANLTRLGELHAQGVLTDDEFATQKARLLGS